MDDRFYVSEDLRNKFIDQSGATYDALKLLFYLVNPIRDDDTWEPIVPYKMVKRLVGSRDNGGIVDRLVKDLMAQTGMVIELSDYSYKDGKARKVTRIEWPDKLNALLQQMLGESLPLGGLVDLLTGKRYGRADVSIYNDQLRQAETVAGKNPVATDLLGMLNKPTKLFTPIRDHVQALKAFSKQLYEEGTLSHANAEIALSHNQQVLTKTYARPQPVYFPVGNSPRIYGAGFINLSRPVREKLFGLMRWHSFDLKSAQLAIVGRVWNIPDVQDFLKKGGNVWHYLSEEIGIDSCYKPALKKALYAVIFGCAKVRVREILSCWDLDQSYAKAFLSVPMIKDLWAARDERKRQIRKEGGISDAFGELVELKPKGQHRDNVRTLLAYEAQSYELALLEDALAYCRERSKIDVVSFLHDGFALKIEAEGITDSVTGKLQQRVQSKAQKLGIITELEGNGGICR
jgi:hypothetical protein